MDKGSTLKKICIAAEVFFALFAAVLFFGIFRHFSFGNFAEVVFSPYYRRLAVSSFKIAFFSAIFSVAVGCVLTFIVSDKKFPFLSLLLAVSKIPFVLPGIIIVLSFCSLFGSSGLFPMKGFLYSFAGIIAAHTYYNFSLPFSIVRSDYLHLSPDRAECSQTLGAGKLLSFAFFIFPGLLKGIVISFLLVFMYCFFSFSVVLVFGGISNSNFETEIFRVFSAGSSAELMSSLSLISIVFSLLSVCIYFFVIKKRTSADLSEEHSRKGGIFDSVIVLIISFLILLPLLSILVSSFRTGKGEPFFANYIKVFTFGNIILKNILFSLSVSVTAVFIAFMLSSYFRRFPHFDGFLLLPQTLSSVMVAAVFRSLSFTPLFVSHLFLTIPFSYFIFQSCYSSYPQDLIEEGRILGSDDFRTAVFAEIPSMRPSVLSAVVFSFAFSLGDVNMCLILTQGRFKTVSTLIYSAVAHYRFGFAAAFAVLMTLTVVLFYLMARTLLRGLHS